MATALAPRVWGLDAICAAALGSAGSEEAAQFARRLFERVADKDLAAAPSEQRAAAAAALLAFARRRLPGVAKVRVFNPTAADHGFESRHTVVQVVNDDMPFLVDSIANELNRREIAVHLLAHPVLAVRRDLDGDLIEVANEAGERARPESMMYLEIDRQGTEGPIAPARRPCRCAEPCAGRGAAGGRGLAGAAPGLPRCLRRPFGQPLAEARRIRGLPPLARGQSLHLPRPSPLPLRRGCKPARRGLRYELLPGSALGILRRDDVRLFEAGLGGGEAMSRFARGPDNILIVKTDRPCLVHRSGPMDCAIVKTYDADGRVTGERRLVGLFTSSGLSRQDPGRAAAARPGRQSCCAVPASTPTAMTARRCWPSSIPTRATSCSRSTRRRSTTMRSASCSSRSAATWRCSRAATRSAGSRPAWCSRRASASTAALSDRFARLLAKAWHGQVTSVAGSSSDESALAQTLYTLKLDTPDSPTPDLAELERALADAATSWNDRLRSALQAKSGEVEGRAAARKWREHFPLDLSRQLRCRTGGGRHRAVAGRARRRRVRRPAGTQADHAAASLRDAPVPPKEADRTLRHPAAGGEPRPARVERGAISAADGDR